MSNIILLFACLVIGTALGAMRRLPETAPAALNGYILHVALPALILVQIHAITFDSALAYSVAMPWLLFALGCAYFWLVGRALGFSPPTTGGLMLVGGLANTSFVGLPMIEAFYGRRDMAIGIVIDQLGTYLVLSTVGITVAAMYSHGPRRGRAVLRLIATFPPLWALAIAIALRPVDFPPWTSDVLRRLGDTLAPIALISVGLQIRLADLRGNVQPLAAGVAFKLLLGPLAVAALYLGWIGVHGEVIRVTLFEAAMGPMIGGAIVASQAGLNPPLVTLMVAVGITLSFLTLPGWWYALGSV